MVFFFPLQHVRARALKRGWGGGGNAHSLPQRPSQAETGTQACGSGVRGTFLSCDQRPRGQAGTSWPLRESRVDTRPVGRWRAAARTGKRARGHRSTPDRLAAACPATGGFVPGAEVGGFPWTTAGGMRTRTPKGARARGGQGTNTPPRRLGPSENCGRGGCGPQGGAGRR